MTDISALSIGLSGVEASQEALNTVGQNLANASTPGYVDEEVALSAVPDPWAGGDHAGFGVQVTGIQRLSDTVLQSSMLQATSTNAALGATSSALSSIQALFPEPASTGALSTQLSAYWSDWSAVASNPTDPSARQALLAQGATVASTLNSLASGVAQVGTQAAGQLSSTVSTVNGLTAQIASLNGQIVASGAGGTPDPGLMDQRDQLINQLSGDININVAQNADGSVTVSTGNGALVSGTSSQPLAVTGSGTSTAISFTSTGGPVDVTGGTIGGLLQVTDSIVPDYQANLDSVANSLESTVNGAQAKGIDLNGDHGAPFFSGTGAAGIAVSLTDPNGIAAASASSPVPTDPTSNLDGSNAALIAGFGTATTVSVNGGAPIQTADSTYTSLVAQLGTQTAAATASSSASAQVLSTATSNYQAGTGVDENQELTEMVQYQNAYEAAARYLSTVQATMQDFLQTIG